MQSNRYVVAKLGGTRFASRRGWEAIVAVVQHHRAAELDPAVGTDAAISATAREAVA